MCGIFGLFLRRPLEPSDIELGRQGTAALRHRGPDAGGEFIDQRAGVYLGHRRLTIVDLTEAGAQPMRLGNLAISYNGEIYNHGDVRAQLSAEPGTQFRSTSDTEVLLHAWRRWGEGALDRVDGMFAFALWDGTRAHLAVDAFGEKPLYCAEVADGICVASELPTLVQLLRPAPSLTGDRLAAFLTLGFIPAPETAYASIRHLAPATRLVIESGRIAGVHRYWRAPSGAALPGQPRELTESDLNRIHAAVTESLEARLRADVPLCIFSSSGVDSTLVAAIARQELGVDVECLTVAFANGVADESAAAAATARTLKLSHRIVQGRDDAEWAETDYFFDLFGQPNDNLSVAASFQLARAARDAGYVVGLTGSGGDEAFFGYQKQQVFWRHRRLFGLPASARRAASAALAPFRRFSQRARIFCDLLGVPDDQLYLAVKNSPAFGGLRDLPGLAAWTKAQFGGGVGPIELEVPVIERELVMPGSQLDSVDVGAMRAGVELRTPFLQRSLFETIAKFDPRSFLAFGQKSVARRLLGRYLRPGDILSGKRGFVFPSQRLLSARAAPGLAALPPRMVERIWSNRAASAAAARLALRLAQLEDFPAWCAGAGTSRDSVSAPEAPRAATAARTGAR